MNPSSPRNFSTTLVVAALLSAPTISRADYTTTLNPGTTWGPWEGWGTSLCWWANVFGNRDDLADVFFTRNYTSFNGATLPGLGMNIARYNAGACSWNSIGGTTMSVSPNISPFRQVAGFWLDWNSSDPNSASWNWSVDANQRAMLGKAKTRGANKFELFSNSPMWWMCYNHNPSGADAGGNDNLQSWNYQAHAIYMANIAKRAQDAWGITFDTVDPFNEPLANWWQASGTQEGCHFNQGTQASVIGLLRTELNNRGLGSTMISASDESFYDHALSTWNSFSGTTKSQVGQINVHGYQYGAGNRVGLYNATLGKKLWNSEYGESDGSGMSLASNLNLDFRYLHPTAWCYWQVLDSGGWGLIASNPGDNWIGGANPKYYVMAQYCRHIRPGMTILDGGEGNTVAAYDAAARKLVIVTANYGTAQWINYDLSRFGIVARSVTRWITVTGSGDKYVQYNDTSVNAARLTSWFPANTIQTFEIDNVDPYISGGPVLNGTYKIVARHSGKALDVASAGIGNGANVWQWGYVGGANQKWTLCHLGNGQYRILGLQSGRALDVDGGSTGDGANVQIWDWLNSSNQRWTIAATSGGYYSIRAVHSGKALDVSGASNADGTNVHQWSYGGGNNQQWIFQAP